MTVDTIVKRGYPVLFGLTLISAIIELSISAWLVSRYNAHHNYFNLGLRDRVRYMLFTSAWTVVLLPLLMALFFMARGSRGASIISHIFFLAITWVFWLAAAAAVTEATGGGLNCSTQDIFAYCGQLNALVAFGWITWILLTIALFIVLLLAIRSTKRGDGYGGRLIDA